ncbi:HesA/MoeB/ThiF family protein [Oligoflexus tunisiensis]|uniref:HesA/MoeB/ThiF family protein n=1 Tax=Oligoflexus tunisiensis TaxID=708132 RepID=UPI000AC37927|nr:ThiF family adenylyltransferase [Oligoflexus tunisiensis]
MIDYSRNWLFIEPDVQKRLGELRLFIMGVGIGSVLAELALRTGIRHITIADGDQVDASNLNRQNYTQADIGQRKVQACAERLRAIDPTASIRVIDAFLDEAMLNAEIPQADIVINTIDFDSPAFLLSNRLARQYDVLELFPMNIGLGSSVCVFQKDGKGWSELFAFDDHVELKHKILQHLAQAARFAPYLQEAAARYFAGERPAYDPQLGISCAISSSLMLGLMIKHVRGEPLKAFPEFYFLDASLPHFL